MHLSKILTFVAEHLNIHTSKELLKVLEKDNINMSSHLLASLYKKINKVESVVLDIKGTVSVFVDKNRSNNPQLSDEYEETVKVKGTLEVTTMENEYDIYIEVQGESQPGSINIEGVLGEDEIYNSVKEFGIEELEITYVK